ncbi:MAG: NADH-quinone oxidoreductase subunit NuoK [Armatimonadetes bacterium]|nr:NADH-quinone oxidoreductase subunit NuoK [Armatimonadota bacterium]
MTLPPVGLPHYLVLAALLFAMGLFAVITRRHAIGLLLGIELMLNAANINLVAFSRYGGLGPTTGLGPGAHLDGHIFALMVIALAACEAAVGLAIILRLYQTLATTDPNKVRAMKW